MNITASAQDPLTSTLDLLVVACDEEGCADNPLVTAIDAALGGALRTVMAAERFRGTSGQTLCLHGLGRTTPVRVALIGLGKRASTASTSLKMFAARAARLAQSTGSPRLGIVPPVHLINGEAPEMLSLGALLGTYRFERYLSEDKRSPPGPQELHLFLGNLPAPAPAILRGQRLATAVAQARHLVNEPALELTPVRLADVAQQMAAKHGLEIKVLGPAECRSQGMGLFLAVAQGSAEEPRFIHLTWRGPGARRRVALIGKGVTFDSGGLSLKPNDGMLDMKTDMAGAAAVISVMAAVAQENLPIEVHALAACTENMPSGTSYKLGDVIRSKSGKTVEINNTDAEGRLTLADALTYARELNPAAIFDFATLTGACMVALGPHTAGVMSNDEALASDWLAAAKAAGEEMWRLPLPERLLEQLKSDIADMKNTGERWGGALTAGLFLKEFAGTVPWVHVDLAGPSTASKDLGAESKGGTGFGVVTIFEYLRRVSSQLPTSG